MAVSWTEAQADAISARKGSVLVAAAAGSGKTAVLVQRAIERLTDPERPTRADRMLIVTFTKAAAAEMRARLERRLYEMLREHPENGLLRRQSILLSQAHIGTVDSFCAEMVREFFHVLEIAPEFKIVSDKQREDLTQEALNETLSDAFETSAFERLADAFTGERDDRRLSAMILQLYEFMQSHPFPESWLEEKTEMFAEPGPIETTPWGRVLLRYAAETAEHCIRVLSAAVREAEHCADEKLSGAFLPALQGDLALAERVRSLAQADSWDELSQFLQTLTFPRRGTLRGYEEDRLKERLELLRGEAKGALQELRELFSSDGEACEEELRCTYPLLCDLKRLTLDFSQRYEEKKREKGFLDYSDLEHLAIRLFLQEDGERTSAAREVSRRFDEIMIDEYQDINEVQDSLFRAISQNGENLFMVGDVKQSIYGFRRAMPEIFLRCRRSFPSYDRTLDRYPAAIVLDRNFRSRNSVTDSVNFVFSRLMSRDMGDIDYTGEEQLVCGAAYPEKDDCETELLLLEREAGMPAEEAEASAIARRIREMLADGFTVCEGGEERPAHYGDFCILLRSANKYAHRYAQELVKRGIPAKASITGGFFAAPEVAVMLSLLRVVDNPNQDIPLLAVLMSPIYGFTADDMAALRLENRDIPLYLSLLRAAGEEKRCAQVVSDIARYRAVAATMPSDAFVSFLYGKTGYADLVLAMEDGEGRLSNLHLLQRYAREYEASGYNGISGFVRFLDRLRQSDSDLQAAEAPAGEEHMVRIMSIHKSKGLEFPVCIVAGCGRNFITDHSDVLLHPELGLGVKLRDPILPARFTTAAREAIRLETARNEASEELRVLYVAMTRAKEKLILVGSGSGLQRALPKLAAQVTEQGISPYAVRSVRNAAHWLLLCALNHPDGAVLRQMAGAEETPVCREGYTPWKISLETCKPEELPAEAAAAELPADPEPELLERLKQQVNYCYPYENQQGIPAKVSASKLTAGQAEEQWRSLPRPAWLGEKGLTPAERGIALHDYMQYADFRAAAEDAAKELMRLREKHYLTPEQAEAVDLARVRKFFSGSLGKRVLASQELQKERRFTAEIPASMAGAVGAEDVSVILQGAVDCTFTENESLHIIDFKTDKINTVSELWERYETQIRLYACAMEQVTGLRVGELFLYSTYLSEGSSRSYHEER